MSATQNIHKVEDGSRLSRNDDWLSVRSDDEVVIMRETDGRYLGLMDPGGRIWELLETPQTIGMLCAKLAEEYDVTPERALDDVAEFVQGLLEHGAVAADSEPNG